MTLSELIRQLQAIQTEVGCDGEAIYSHKLKSRVVIDTPTATYEVDAIEPTLLPGCGCWDGVRIMIKEED